VRQLSPYYANLGKRQVKSPKIYLRDSGLLHNLLGIESMKGLLEHPKAGASWEGFVIEQILMTEPHDEAFFWATHQGAEMDLILRRGTELLGIECKRTDSPRMTPSISIAMDNLGLSRVILVYPGIKPFSLSEKVVALPFSSLATGRPIFPEATR
jgi:predicted AAA+ superfamily ATPase